MNPSLPRQVCLSASPPPTISRPQATELGRPANQMTSKQAINALRSHVKHVLPTGAHVYTCNVLEKELEAAYTLLDKEKGRQSMRITYSDQFNFIVRFMPTRMHDEAERAFEYLINNALLALIPEATRPGLIPGCGSIGSTTHQLGPRKKQPDGGFRPMESLQPSLLIEIGCSESMTQLKIDAKLWIEHNPEVQLVILLCIDPPLPAHPNLPKITIQMWRGVAPDRPVRAAHAQRRNAQMVWEADWTLSANPFYVLFADIFRGDVPNEYGAGGRVVLIGETWRQHILRIFQQTQLQ